MKELSKHIEQKWSSTIKLIDKKLTDEIYAFSFFVYDHDDDPRYPTLTIGYNTYSNLQKQIDIAANEAEAKWNYAYWLQNEIAVVGNEKDNSGKLLINNWITKLGLNYTDQEVEKNYVVCGEKGEQISKQFIKILIEIVKNSHANELTDKPILIHELEYYDKIKNQNIKANGKERVKEFSKWINNL